MSTTLTPQKVTGSLPGQSQIIRHGAMESNGKQVDVAIEKWNDGTLLLIQLVNGKWTNVAKGADCETIFNRVMGQPGAVEFSL